MSAKSSQIENHVSDEVDALAALKRCNWNMVINTQKFINNDADISTPALVFHPLAVVMIWIDVGDEKAEFSDAFVNSCVRGGSIYGTIGLKTHIVVQLFFSGLSKRNNKDSTREPKVDHGVGIIIVDANCDGYVYNMPPGQYEKLGVCCAERLMEFSLKTKITNMVKMVPFSERSKYDEYLYAMFKTIQLESQIITKAVLTPQ